MYVEPIIFARIPIHNGELSKSTRLLLLRFPLKLLEKIRTGFAKIYYKKKLDYKSAYKEIDYSPWEAVINKHLRIR